MSEIISIFLPFLIFLYFRHFLGILSDFGGIVFFYLFTTRDRQNFKMKPGTRISKFQTRNPARKIFPTRNPDFRAGLKNPENL